MNLEFFYSKVKKSKVLVFDEDLKEAECLENQGFYTSAFLRHWQVIEAVCRELMILYRTCNEVSTLSKKLFKKLTKQSVDFKAYNLDSQICDVLFSETKKRLETSTKYIDVGVIGKAFESFELGHDMQKLRYLMASQLKEKDEIPEGGTHRKTIREQRNEIIHRNGSLQQEEFDKIMPFIRYFFDLIAKIKEREA